ncbi:murein L,D-transpeptidase catalytic domain-containing protein [Flavobacterium terrisoli]|uniref:murein L,D-transpeptidase catalytic domain-containing protein n=1 Tax=Flavobacterium terrisoli TaxID=3242195 RepID=UPI0025439CFB|nr:murein L,D-transpeptidase catalytic domain family protein [Flavobacterium buctense]
MKNLFWGILIIIAVCSGYHFVVKKSSENHIAATVSNDITNQRLKSKVDSIKTFLAKKTEYNNEVAFFIDMKIKSGKNRFFIYNLKENKVIDEGLVAHGSGSETGIEGQLKFSNTPNSNSSSLGKYAIGNHYNGKFGKAYKLYGLDRSNSKAFDRFIVLHYFSKVPYEQQINPICNSLGCPMVNEKYFKRIEKILDKTEKKILLTIYY